MDAKQKEQLENVITSTINGDAESASKVFHDYLRSKMSAMVVAEQEDDMEDEVGDEDKEEAPEEDREEREEDREEDKDEDEHDDDEDEDVE